MASPVRLHLGCGAKWWPGYVNLDDEVDLLDLPYSEVDEIHAIHLFEHLPRLEIVKYLTHWHEILRPGGKLVLEMPCMDKIANMIVQGCEDPRLTLLGIFGDEREENPLMLHKWCYTQKELGQLLTEAGFSVKFQEPHYHIKDRDMRVEAIK